MKPELWGTLRAKYETERPRRMLSLDGGGIRGLITLGILENIEAILRYATGEGDSFRLGEWFDYIGGTSTGAILAAALARGMTVAELIDFYVSTGPEMFEKNRLLQRFWSLYKSDPLKDKLRQVMNQPRKGDLPGVGDKDLDLSPDYLRCLLLVVTRNATTDSPWPVSSHPEAKYNAPDRKDCNLRIPLWRLVRASTAAPVYFPPEVLNWDPSDPEKSFVFVDGGMTPYNNPSFLLYRMATQEPYRLRWKTGEKNLLLISVGTGEAERLGPSTLDPQTNLVGNVATIPGNLMNAMSIDQDLNCRTVGRCTHGSVIDRELLDLICRESQDDLTLERITKAPSIPLERDLNPDEVQKLDAINQIDNLLAIGRAVGQDVKAEHFGGFLKPV